MSYAIENHIKSYIAHVAIAAYVVVKKHSTAGEVVVASAGDSGLIGITMANAAADTVVPVRLLNGMGTALVLCGDTVDLNAAVSVMGSAGAVDDDAGGPIIGYAEEAGVVGDIIEVVLGGHVLPALVASANQTTLTDNTGGSVTNATLVAGVTSVAITGTLTGSANGVVEDVAASPAGCGGATTPSSTQVDAAIAVAIAPIVTGVNLQLKELLTQLNVVIADLGKQNSNDAKIAELTNAILAACVANGIAKGSA